VHSQLDRSCPSFNKALCSSMIFGICLRVAAPVLKTLTSSYSSDTIHALAIIFSSVHLVFYDYAFIDNNTMDFSGTLSLNAAMFTAVLLASRLENVDVVAAFVFLAVILFSFMPLSVRLIKLHSPQFHVLTCILLWLVATIMLIVLDSTLFTVYQVLVALVWFICPLWYLYFQRYKKSLKGPWDIAILQRNV